MSKQDREPYSQKSVRSFVVRSGKFTKGQEQSYQRLGSKYCLEYRNFSSEMQDARNCQDTLAHEQELYWQSLLCPNFGSPKSQLDHLARKRQRLLCEIGFGTGSSTWQIAQQFPDALYLGIEVYRSGIASLMQKAEEQQLEQLRIIEHDALEVLENMLPTGILDGLHIFFPDPWPKKRHQKRRIVNAENLQLFHSSLKLGGYFYFVTDWQDYAEAVRKILREQENLWDFGKTAQIILQGQAYSEPQNWRPQSKFEAKAQQEGRSSFELYLTKKA